MKCLKSIKKVSLYLDIPCLNKKLNNLNSNSKIRNIETTGISPRENILKD